MQETISGDLANILRSAKARLTISGSTLDKLARSPGVREALVDVLNRGVQVTMMQLNPHSLYHQLESCAATSDQHLQTLEFLQQVFKTLLPGSRPRLRVLLTSYMPHFQIVIADESVFVYFYMYRTGVSDTPDLVLRSADQNDTLRRRLIASTTRQLLAPETIPYIQHGRIYEHWEHSKLASWDSWTPEERNAHRLTHEFYATHAAQVHQRVGFALENEVKAHLDLLRGRTLVLGCGSGKEVDHLASKRPDDQVLGVDFSSEAIALARSRFPKLAECFVQGDLYDMEALFDGTFDSIAANAALVHLLKRDDLELVLRLIWNKLSPGGRVFIRALYKEGESGPLKDEIYQDKRWNAPRWYVYYSRAELVTMSRHIGFKVLERETQDIAVDLLRLDHTALSDALSKGFRHDELENAYWPCILLERPIATNTRPGSSSGRPALASWLAGQHVSLDDLSLGSALGELARVSAGAAPAMRGKLRTGGESPLRVVMPLCQKVGATGSGVVVREVVDHLARRGVSSLVLCGAEAGERSDSLFENSAIQVESVVFGRGQGSDLPFPIVGMSDRMPYPSTRFVDLTVEQLEAYLEVWRDRITQSIRRFQPHVIHVHHFWLLAAMSAACAGDLPLIVSVHGTDLQQAHKCPHLRELVASWGSRIDRIIALTKDSASEIRELFAVHPAKISVLGNGFNGKLFYPLEAPQQEVLERYRIGALGARRVILFVGKYVEWKGVVWLLHAFAAVAMHRLDAVLVVGGTGPETERRRYVELARSLRVEDKVYFTGAVAQEDIRQLMNLASVFVLPSYREPFGLVLLEALACGSRIVATDQAGPAEFVPDELKVSGDAILVQGLPDADPDPPESASFVQRLANAIGVQLDKPQSVQKRRQIAASIAGLTWDRYVDELLALYRSS
jgi:glycosyltransferase involved in cell wall biosynthesis/2-polyprenyl-3-methyl-5-hydroxy-6-metoxy-1,4-benzoquinol methylase